MVHNVYPEWSSVMDNTFTRFGGFYYVLIPGYGILKSVDLIHYDDFYQNSDLLNLFFDHTGVMIAKDQDYNSVYYRKDQ
jgi:hypothetical protein